MKFTKLLVMSALWLVGLSANAADLIERTQPTNADVDQTPVAFQAGGEYLLYNTGAKMFFSQGNAWGTRASGNENVETALRVSLQQYAPEGDWDLTTYVFKVYSSVRNTIYSWHECFFDSQTAMFVDHASQDNYFWEVEDMGNNVYRLKAAQANPSIQSDGTQYVGRDDSVEQDAANLIDIYDNANAYPLSPMLVEGEGVHIDWVFYSAAVFAQYDKSQELKAAIEKAEEAGIDIAAAVAVYNNLQATVEEMAEQIEALEQAMKDNIANATGEHPQDASSWITNATFDTVGNFTGWSGTAFGAGGTTSTNAEHYSKTFDTYQDVTIQYPGLYIVGVNGFYRAGSANDAYTHFVADDEQSKYVKFYATVGDETAEKPVVSIFKGAPTEKPAHGAGMQNNGYWIPNTMADAEKYMHQDGLYGNLLYIEVPEADATMRIGVKKATTISTDWAIFDDFSLTYYGSNLADAYQGVLNKLIQINYPDVAIDDNTLYTEQYLNDYEEARLGKTATNREELEAALAPIETAYAALRTNLDLWKQLQAKVAELKTYTINDAYAKQADDEETTEFANAFFDLQDYEEEDYLAIIDVLALTNEELEAEIEKVGKMIDRFVEAVKNDLKAGDDVTDFLVNADFEQGNTGWLGASSITAFSAGCAEAYEKNPFDLYQVVTGLKPGVYSISLQGFFRTGSNDAAYAEWKAAKDAGTTVAPVAWVYLNENTTALNNVFDIEGQIDSNDFFDTNLIGPAAYAGTDADGNTWYFPNGMSTSHDCFEAGMYTKAAYGLVRAGEEMRVGIKGTLGGSQWAIWDNFKLTYEGYDFATIKPLLEEAIAELDKQVADIEAYTEEGRQSMAKSIRDRVEAVKAAAAQAIAAEDGTAAFETLSDAFALKAAITTSAALFETLNGRLAALETALYDAVNEALAAETQLWFDDILDKIGQGELEDEDAQEILDQIDERIAKLQQPDPAQADDDNSFDVTNVIVNPDYDATTGWSGTNASYRESCAEIFNANFDYYQDLNYLNEGTYEVRVQGFYRAGTSAEDFESFTTAPDHKNYAYIYAMASDSIVRSIPMKRLASQAVQGDSLDLPSDQYVFAVAPVDSTQTPGWYVANTMTSAQTEFLSGNYKNEGLFVKVAQDGKLRIGLKKEVNISNNWTIWDSWQLVYYGKDSQKELSGDASLGITGSVAELQTVSVEYFTLEGRKVLRAQKGLLIQKTTLSNGTVVVRKVRR